MENETKNNIKRNGIIFSIIGGVLVLGGILGSYAFFQTVGGNNQKEILSVQAGNMELIFSDGNNGFETELEFGESATKTFTITNNGSLDAVAKINWKNLVNTYLEESLSYSLTYIENEGDTPVEVITDKNVPTSTVASTINLANGLSIPAGKTYTYTLTITLNYLESTDQTADLNARLSTEFSLEEGSIVTGPTAAEVLLSKLNESSVTDYETANKAEMFAFEHEAAEQTPALTDYRYVGNEPNNYIHFNDETWRIIGVFSVQSTEDGEYKQRIKIIREESIGDLAWDADNKNDWATSSLSTLLNTGDYYNRTGDYAATGLTDVAKTQISPAKWYLGSILDDGLTPFKEQLFYSYERGIETCTTIGSCSEEAVSINTIQNVGLIYPSDVFYSYPDSENKISGNWLFSTTNAHTFITLVSGISTLTYSSNGDYSARVSSNDVANSRFPVVYLRADAEFASGTGAVDDMYELKP